MPTIVEGATSTAMPSAAVPAAVRRESAEASLVGTLVGKEFSLVGK